LQGVLKLTLISIGFGNLISAERLVTILNPDSSPIKRLIHLAKEKDTLIDASCGRKTQSVLIMDSGNVILSALSCETITNKLFKNEDNKDG
jgi:extracellular matrix regulatory protein A